VFTTLSAFFGGLTSFVLIVVFSFYFSVQETGVDDFLRVVTPNATRPTCSPVEALADKIGKWMQGQLMLGIIVGVLLYLGLTILGHPQRAFASRCWRRSLSLSRCLARFWRRYRRWPSPLSTAESRGRSLVAGSTWWCSSLRRTLFTRWWLKRSWACRRFGHPLAYCGRQAGRLFGHLLSVPIAGAIQELVADIDRRKARELAKPRLRPRASSRVTPWQKKPFYLTTTLPYVNADPHIGFALEFVHADIVARYQRLMGREVFFTTGTDEHGQKIFKKRKRRAKMYKSMSTILRPV
jgi:hypothetical protein